VQDQIGTGAAAALYASVSMLAGGGIAATVLAGVAAAVAAVALNTILVGGFLAVERQASARQVLRALLWPMPHSIAFAVAALLLSALYGAYGPLAVGFLLVPLAVLRHARRGKVELDEARERTLRAFVSAVELKDDYLWRHSERVAHIAAAILQRLRGTDEEVERAYYAALLHDIGKIAIPDEVIN
jgi:HD-GYP domain-containing protein (c-di-GMP phosphodiesterase class II)